MSTLFLFELCAWTAARSVRVADEVDTEDAVGIDDGVGTVASNEFEEPIPFTICRAPAIMSSVGERPRMGRNAFLSIFGPVKISEMGHTLKRIFTSIRFTRYPVPYSTRVLYRVGYHTRY